MEHQSSSNSPAEKGNPNGPQQGNGRNRRVTDREPSFRASALDRKDGTHHEEQLSSNRPSVIQPSSATTGTHAGTPPLPAKKSGTGVEGWGTVGGECRLSEPRSSDFNRTNISSAPLKEETESFGWLSKVAMLRGSCLSTIRPRGTAARHNQAVLPWTRRPPYFLPRPAR